jgi:glc operon protein GlcG
MQLPTRKVLTIEAAKRLADVAKAHAASLGHPNMIVVVVDPGGHLLYLERMDGVDPGTVEVAILKARSSALFGLESKGFREAVDNGLISLIGLPGMAAFEGAVPIMHEGEILGAIAISGIDEPTDGAAAHAAADALAGMLSSA